MFNNLKHSHSESRHPPLAVGLFNDANDSLLAPFGSLIVGLILEDQRAPKGSTIPYSHMVTQSFLRVKLP